MSVKFEWGQKWPIITSTWPKITLFVYQKSPQHDQKSPEVHKTKKQLVKPKALFVTRSEARAEPKTAVLALFQRLGGWRKISFFCLLFFFCFFGVFFVFFVVFFVCCLGVFVCVFWWFLMFFLVFIPGEGVSSFFKWGFLRVLMRVFHGFDLFVLYRFWCFCFSWLVLGSCFFLFSFVCWSLVGFYWFLVFSLGLEVLKFFALAEGLSNYWQPLKRSSNTLLLEVLVYSPNALPNTLGGINLAKKCKKSCQNKKTPGWFFLLAASQKQPSREYPKCTV